MSVNNKLIILCSTQRSGSTMIVEDFRNCEVLGRPEEYFIPWEPSKQQDWILDFEDIMEKASSKNGVAAIKVMASQLKNIELCLSTINYPKSEQVSYFPRVKELFSKSKFIRIKRENIVRQAVSRIIASKTGVNHALSRKGSKLVPGNLLKGSSDYNKDVKFRADEINGAVVQIAKETLLWDEVLKDWGEAQSLQLRYEDVCEHYPDYLQHVAGYLDVNIDMSILPEKRALTKLSNSKNDQVITNYIPESLLC